MISRSEPKLRRLDFFILIMGILFLGVSILEMAKIFSITPTMSVALFFFVNVICFNSTHVIVTFVNIWMIPEYKKVAIDYLKLNLFKQLLMLAMILAIFLFVYDRVLSSQYLLLRTFLIQVLLFFPIFHGARQSLGLSLLMNVKSLEAGTLSAASEQKSRRLEHRTIWMLMAGTYLNSLSYFYSEFNLSPSILWAGQVLGFLTVAVAFLFLFSALFALDDSRLKSEKLVFSLRYGIRALVPFSLPAMFYSMAVHGLEYMDLQKRTLGLSAIHPHKKKFYLLLCFLLLIGFALLLYPLNWSYNDIESSGLLAKGLGITALVFTYFHYVLDSLIYRMKDPNIRKQIMPVIKL